MDKPWLEEYALSKLPPLPVGAQWDSYAVGLMLRPNGPRSQMPLIMILRKTGLEEDQAKYVAKRAFSI